MLLACRRRGGGSGRASRASTASSDCCTLSGKEGSRLIVIDSVWRRSPGDFDQALRDMQRRLPSEGAAGLRTPRGKVPCRSRTELARKHQ